MNKLTHVLGVACITAIFAGQLYTVGTVLSLTKENHVLTEENKQLKFVLQFKEAEQDARDKAEAAALAKQLSAGVVEKFRDEVISGLSN